MNSRIKAVAVLVVLSLVSAVLLTLASHFLPPAPLVINDKMKQTIYDLAASKDVSALDLDLSKSTDSNGEQLILFVFKIESGANNGAYVVFSKGLGRNDYVTMAVMIKDDTVIGAAIYDNGPGNNYVTNNWDDYQKLVKTGFNGLKPDQASNFNITGATISSGGMKMAAQAAVNFIATNKANISSAPASKIDMSDVKGAAPVVSKPSKELTSTMLARLADLGYETSGLVGKDIVYNEKQVHGAYAITSGEQTGNVLIIGQKTDDYGTVYMVVEFNSSASVAIKYIEIGADFEGIEEAHPETGTTADLYRFALETLNYTAIWAGKTSTEIARLDLNTGANINAIASLASTPNTVTSAVKSAVECFESNKAILFVEA